MGEIVVDIPESVPALPSSDTSFEVPGPLRLWFSTGHAHAGLLLALSPLAIFVTIFLMILVVDITESAAAIGFFLLVLFGVFIGTLLSISSVLARVGRNRQVRDAAQQYGPRLQSSKDWYVRGDITEGEFEQLRGLIEPAITEKAPAIQAQTTASTIRTFALMLSIATAILVPINTIAIFELLFEGDEGILILFALLMIDTATVFLILTGWRTAKVARAAAKALQAQITKRIEALENEILRSARGRRVGAAGSGSTAPYGTGPSFRAYGGR